MKLDPAYNREHGALRDDTSDILGTTGPVLKSQTTRAEIATDLVGLDLLNAEPEQPFEDVAELLSELCGKPVSFVSFMDPDTQWFKARRGTDMTCNSIEDSVCAHVLTSGEMVEISDLSQDPRTRNLVPVREHGLRFYAGVPLKSKHGNLFGAVCVMDTQPGALTEFQRKAIVTMARQVQTQVDLRRMVKTQETLRQEVDHRVKNSLQSVSAQIRLKARASKSPETREALKRIETRIQTIAALHEAMYRTSATNRVNIGTYAGNLIQIISQFAPAGVRVTADVANLSLTSEQASAVAVIFNEFAMNSFKYAFPEGRSGTVAIEMQTLPDGRAVLTFSDDGIGMGNSTLEGGTGLGLRVIEASAQQLAAILEWDESHAGARATLVFEPRT